MASQVPSRAKIAENAKKEVEKWVRRCLDKGVENLRMEFLEVKRYVPAGMCCDTFKKHQEAGRNRYQDVPCQDKGRIVLKPPAPVDYIHANYVATPVSDKRFICAQGPLDCTVADFWYMIVQEGTDSIIMLCNVIEKGVWKCAQYWPENCGETMKFDNDKISVTVKEKRSMTPDETTVVVSVLEVKWKEDGKDMSREVRHFQWQDWPDRGVPPCRLTSTELLSRVRGSKQPIVVHCSAGIGRTGTIVAVEYILERLQKGLETVNMDVLLKELRDQRPYTIQNDMQYLYTHRVMLCYFFEKYKHEALQKPDMQAKYKQFVVEYDKATT